MSSDKFNALIHDYCRHKGLDAASQVLQGAPLQVDGVLFAIRHESDTHPEFAHVYCDLGVAPEEHPEEIYRLLLECNMSLHPLAGQAMMISPYTGHILLATSVLLRTATVKTLDDVFDTLSQVAREWRKNFEDNGAFPGTGGESSIRSRILDGVSKSALVR